MKATLEYLEPKERVGGLVPGWPLALLLGLTVAGGGLAVGAHASGEGPANGPFSGMDWECHRVESERFVFHSEPWINLHHFLFQWARNVPERPSGDRRRAVEVPEQARLVDLDEEAQQAWNRALDFYREELIAGSLLFDRDLIALRGQLAEVACSPAGLESIDPGLRTVLVEALPVYGRYWWPEHQIANEAWIETQLDKLESYGPILGERLAQAYGGDWPSERVRVDVVAYANWAGAYTTNHPNQVTLSSIDYEGLEGLELLFHEVSHASFFEQRILRQVADAFQPYGVDPPDRLAHSIQFATPAELLRSLLADEEQDRFLSVAERVYERGSFRDQYQVVLEHWRPYLDGQVERAAALDRIAAALVPEQGTE